MLQCSRSCLGTKIWALHPQKSGLHGGIIGVMGWLLHVKVPSGLKVISRGITPGQIRMGPREEPFVLWPGRKPSYL